MFLTTGMDNNDYLGKAVVAFISGTGTALLLRNFFWLFRFSVTFLYFIYESLSDSASGITGLTCVSLASTTNFSLGTPATNSPIISSTSDRPNTGTSYTTATREIRINVNKPTNGRLSALQARSAKPPKWYITQFHKQTFLPHKSTMAKLKNHIHLQTAKILYHTQDPWHSNPLLRKPPPISRTTG